jgi:hypothetical protein
MELRHALFVIFPVDKLVSDCGERDSVDSEFSQVESVLEKSIMETLTAAVACGVAFALSFHLGYGRAASIWGAATWGAVTGLGIAVAFFAMTVATTIILPGTFDGRALGLHFLALLVVAPLGAAVVAILARRYAMAKMHF